MFMMCTGGPNRSKFDQANCRGNGIEEKDRYVCGDR